MSVLRAVRVAGYVRKRMSIAIVEAIAKLDHLAVVWHGFASRPIGWFNLFEP